MKKIRILIADDHSVVRIGLAALFKTVPDFEVVGTAKDGEEAAAKTLAEKPDVVIMDLLMPGLNGIDATKEIVARTRASRSPSPGGTDQQPRPRVLILTTFATSDGIMHAFDAGASGAVLKTSSDEELIASIRRIASGDDHYLSDEVRQLICEDPPVEELTKRQREILEDVTRGLTNSDIANHFGIREASVKEHLVGIFGKIGASNRAEAVAIALRKHLLKI